MIFVPVKLRELDWQKRFFDLLFIKRKFFEYRSVEGAGLGLAIV